MHKKLLVILSISALLLTASILGAAQAQQQDQYTLQLQGSAWDKTTLKILIINPQNETWWNPLYINSTIHAVNQWNEAIADFTANYTNFNYLSRLNLIPTIANQTKIGFDVTISWAENSTSESGDEIGLTVITNDPRSSVVVKAAITLSARNTDGVALTETDTQNVALHELGHVLGIAHSNYTGDIMYPTIALNSQVRAISTLDMYGVATMFQWINNPRDFYPVSGWLKISSVTSPTDIDYKLIVTAENQPKPTLNNPIQEFLLTLLRPEILTITLLLILLGLIATFLKIYQKIFERKKTRL